MSIIFETPSPSNLDYWGPVILNFMGLFCILAAVWQGRSQYRPGKATFLYLIACILFLCAAPSRRLISITQQGFRTANRSARPASIVELLLLGTGTHGMPTRVVARGRGRCDGAHRPIVMKNYAGRATDNPHSGVKEQTRDHCRTWTRKRAASAAPKT